MVDRNGKSSAVRVKPLILEVEEYEDIRLTLEKFLLNHGYAEWGLVFYTPPMVEKDETGYYLDIQFDNYSEVDLTDIKVFNYFVNLPKTDLILSEFFKLYTQGVDNFRVKLSFSDRDDLLAKITYLKLNN